MADQYVQACREHPEKPMTLLAEKTGLDGSQLRGVIYQARRRGFLTSAPAGAAGGQLTRKALSVLKRKVPTAWDQATDEQRRAAVAREDQFAALDAALAAQHIDRATYEERYQKLLDEMFGEEG